ncbi:MAG: undecaprenyldiphospho-muramoylpentapeptide beta-N-acetylglucosaminyltransferase [Verrucomicrobia bacterium]|nr:undecaprenyldiphospho-muramoylpentapeptide beta-N-acetylglucosaminyltransferase [Verrucomicrobiota bacterium]MDE3099362.1 undecaprenyldiphospho-muramoylpentapeptide beta-N-acetylglucosaminyltransferase [Verrucomicrobiota bacterium]
MSAPAATPPFFAIACGGTGGHLFPGLAVARELQRRHCRVALLVSPKDVDREAAQSAEQMEILTLPAVGLQRRNYLRFASGFWKSYSAARKIFRARRPAAALSMGGFTGAPPVLAAKRAGAATFLHESNSVPGRANRLLARFVDKAFVGFSGASQRLNARSVSVTGTPVRPEFFRLKAAECRAALGLALDRPVILVMGGSQGARGINDLIPAAMPFFAGKNWQWLHLTGAQDCDRVKAAYARCGTTAIVRPFLAEMDRALGAATAAVSRAGASSLAEIAAARLPSLLIPFPAAADNHQLFNALAFEKTGAARCLDQKEAAPEKVAAILAELVDKEPARREIQKALARWDAPGAAEQIAANMLEVLAARGAAGHEKLEESRRSHASGGPGSAATN